MARAQRAEQRRRAEEERARAPQPRASLQPDLTRRAAEVPPPAPDEGLRFRLLEFD